MSDTGIMRQDEYFDVLDAVKNHIITAQKTSCGMRDRPLNRVGRVRFLDIKSRVDCMADRFW